LALGAGDLGLPGAGDLGRPGATGDLDWPATAGDGDLGLPGPGDLGRGGLVAPPAGCSAGALNEPMPNGSSDCSSSKQQQQQQQQQQLPALTHSG